MSSVPQNVIKHKVGLLNLAAELGNVSRAYGAFGHDIAGVGIGGLLGHLDLPVVGLFAGGC